MTELLARGYYTIAVVSDGYLVSLTTPSVSIPANHDGSNPDYTNANTEISVYRGKELIDFNVVKVATSDNGIQYNLVKHDNNKWKILLTSIPRDILSGYLDIHIETIDKYTAITRFVFSIVKNASGLEWIDEWNGTYTQIGDNYVITPRLFAGHKSPDGKITGVYLGKLKGYLGQSLPYQFTDPEEGIYGYRDDKIVFYINNNEARIAGWDITPNAIQCLDGTLTIKSEGSISSQTKGRVHWSLNKDGSASFANGKVYMDALGNATFDGKIITGSGNIGGWDISSDSISKVGLSINSAQRHIAIANIVTTEGLAGGHLDWVKEYGGVALYYISNADYGFVGYKGNKLVFSAGHKNYIAGWNFDENAIFIGVKNNNIDQYTNSKSYITIGTNGIRGCAWYFNADGSGSLAKGKIKWDINGNVTLAKDVTLSWENISGAMGNRFTHIDANGIYTGTIDAAKIISGFISADRIESGMITADKLAANSITADKIAAGTITADKIAANSITADKLDAASIKVDIINVEYINGLSCNFDKGTIGGWHINKDSISTNTISLGADGTISNSTFWELNKDGSGSLGGGSISWGVDGNAKFSGEIIANSGSVGGFVIKQYSLINKNNVSCYVSMTKNNSSDGYQMGQRGYKELCAAIGNSLSATAGQEIPAIFKHYNYDPYGGCTTMIIRAAGGQHKRNVFGGNENICIDAIGGVDWHVNTGDHWSMPGLLAIIRFSYNNDIKEYSIRHVWGNGIPPIDYDASHWSSSNQLGVIKFAGEKKEFYTVTGQAIGPGYTADYKNTDWNQNIVIESFDKNGFIFSSWYMNQKYIPTQVDLFLYGFPD